MELLRAVRLDDKAHAYSRTLSGGMKRRLLVAKALVHTPPVLVLDEPTAGVDIELRAQLWEYVRELHAGGTTVVLTTHYLEEAEALCDRIAIVDGGRIVANDLTSTLLATAQDKIIDRHRRPRPRRAAAGPGARAPRSGARGHSASPTTSARPKPATSSTA